MVVASTPQDLVRFPMEWNFGKKEQDVQFQILRYPDVFLNIGSSGSEFTISCRSNSVTGFSPEKQLTKEHTLTLTHKVNKNRGIKRLITMKSYLRVIQEDILCHQNYYHHAKNHVFSFNKK